MTSSFLKELQLDTSPVTIADIQAVAGDLIKTYDTKSVISLESSTFSNLLSNTALIIRRMFIQGSYEPTDTEVCTFDVNVVKWLSLRERLVASPVIVNMDLLPLVALLDTLNRDVFSKVEGTLEGLNKTLSGLINRPEDMMSITGSQGLNVPVKNLVSSSDMNKIKTSITDRSVSIKIGRLYNSTTEIKTISAHLHRINLEYARLELSDILKLHDRTVELIEALVSDSKGLSTGTSAKQLLSTMTGVAVTLEALSASLIVLDKLTLLSNAVVTSANEAYKITIADQQA